MTVDNGKNLKWETEGVAEHNSDIPASTDVYGSTDKEKDKRNTKFNKKTSDKMSEHVDLVYLVYTSKKLNKQEEEKKKKRK